MKGVQEAAPKRPESSVTILHRNTYLYVVPKGHRPIPGATRRATTGELADLAEAFRSVHDKRGKR